MLESKITLQLLLFYSLFILPLLLGGIELYFFQRSSLQQSFQQSDKGLAQSIAFEIEANTKPVSSKDLTSQLLAIQKNFIDNSNNGKTSVSSAEIGIWITDEQGKELIGTAPSLQQSPSLENALSVAFEKKPSDSVIVPEQAPDWSYSYASFTHNFTFTQGTHWEVVVGRPVATMLVLVISFQRSLIIALVMLVIGASLFWFAMHGWVVAPLSRLAQVVKMIKPDQTVKMTESKLLAKERNRVDEIGQLIAAFSTMEDEMQDLFRKSDKESQARRQKLDAMMQSMNEGVLLESPEGQIEYANRSFMQFVGIPSKVVIPDSFNVNHLSDSLLEMVENPDAYREAIQQTEQSGGPQTIDFQVRGRYNQVGQLVPGRRDIRMRHFDVRDQEGQLIGRGKIFNDVTRQNEAERVKKNLLAIVSHELRTPLTAIKGCATSLLETDVKLENTVQERFLQRIVEEGDRMADLVTNLLEMSQLEAGTLKLHPGLYRLDIMIEQIISAYEPCHVRANIPGDLPLLYVDRRRIEMVLRNLIENARRYAGPEASIEIAARYEQDRADEGLYLSVSDNGPGLPEELTERIFEHFYQIDSGRERSSGGVGLGLAICRGFVGAHGGRIRAENRTDGTTGAVFHIWLPARVLRTSTAQPSLFDLHKAL